MLPQNSNKLLSFRKTEGNRQKLDQKDKVPRLQRLMFMFCTHHFQGNIRGKIVLFLPASNLIFDEDFISELSFINMCLFTMYFVFLRKYLILPLNWGHVLSLIELSRDIIERQTHLLLSFPLCFSPFQQKTYLETSEISASSVQGLRETWHYLHMVICGLFKWQNYNDLTVMGQEHPIFPLQLVLSRTCFGLLWGGFEHFGHLTKVKLS